MSGFLWRECPMRGRCLTAYPAPYEWSNGASFNQCQWCCGYRPFGPAKLDGEHAATVAIELRAAEIAAGVSIGIHDATEDEAKGWDAWIGSWHSHGTTYDIDEQQWHPVNDAEEAGWLARAIHEATR